MNKIILTTAILLSFHLATVAQRYAFVDTEYVLQNIPAHQAAQEQLNQQARRWQQEVEALYQEVSRMYQEFQTESVFLSNEMRVNREEAIIAKEREAKILQHRYFGPEGEMSKQQQNLIQPIQDQVVAAIREIARQDGLAVVFDKSAGILYLDPAYDISNQVLERLGHRR